jgi:hypothetical protein
MLTALILKFHQLTSLNFDIQESVSPIYYIMPYNACHSIA